MYHLYYMFRPTVMATTCVLLLQANAQVDSSAVSTRPWIEFTGGLWSPAGLLGLGAGVPVNGVVIPCAALGFGRTEGAHFSVGTEAPLGRDRMAEARAFVYLTYTIGSADDDDPRHSVTTSDGTLAKVGLAYAIRMHGVAAVARLGYAWSLAAPTVTIEGDGVSTSRRRHISGLLLSIGVAIPLARGSIPQN
jgi:hypothetical protein